MLINNTPINADLEDILDELRNQLKLNNIPLLRDTRDTPDNIMVTCPYHKNGQERKPSAGLKKLDGKFHCFTCGETHDLVEVISYCFGRYDDILGVFGWEWILKNFLTISIDERKPISLDYSRDNSSKETIDYVTDEELNSYRYYHSYMYKRKMTDDVIDIFDIGYDKATQCITFPVRDKQGNCLFVARRSVNTKFFNYPSGVVKPVYGLYELYKLPNFPDEVIICESMIDAITCWVYGKYAVALNGLGNNLQFDQLNAMPCRKFILATDNDEAGSRARKRIRQNIKRKLISEYKLPEGKKDINELSAEEFKVLKEII